MNNPFLRQSIFCHMRTSLPSFPNYGVGIGKEIAAAGFETVMFKGLQGSGVFRVKTNWLTNKYEDNITSALVEDCHAAGLAVCGYSYLDDSSPTLQGIAAGSMVDRFHLDGWAWNVEEKFDLLEGAAARLLRVLDAFSHRVPTAYVSWPILTHAHPSDVARVGAEGCDVVMPMAYWRSHNPESFLRTAYGEWRAITGKPIVPIGRAFSESGIAPTADEIRAFGHEAFTVFGLPAVSWWFLDHARKNPAWWDALDAVNLSAPAVLPPVGVGWDIVRDESGEDWTYNNNLVDSDTILSMLKKGYPNGPE